MVRLYSQKVRLIFSICKTYNMSIPRFSHTCKITRTSGNSQTGPSVLSTIYEGSCRKDLNKFDDSHNQNAANTAQWMVSLPIIVMVKLGDSILLNDGIANVKGIVIDWETTNVEHENSNGVFRKDGDNVISLDGTVTKGIHLYVSVSKN